MSGDVEGEMLKQGNDYFPCETGDLIGASGSLRASSLFRDNQRVVYVSLYACCRMYD